MSGQPNYGTDVDACRGTLVAHGDGGLDCTDDACALPDPARHVLIVSCTDVLGGCCVEPGIGKVARAS